MDNLPLLSFREIKSDLVEIEKVRRQGYQISPSRGGNLRCSVAVSEKGLLYIFIRRGVYPQHEVKPREGNVRTKGDKVDGAVWE